MANTLTGLIPDLYQALDIVSRELTGFIPSVALNAEASAAGKDQTIRIPVAGSYAAADITPGVNAPDTGDQTIDYADITISKSRAVPIRWNGEEQKSYAHNGQMVSTFALQSAQAMRTLVNEIETLIAQKYINASRAYGTAGTTPFASSLVDAAQAKKILDDNGAPEGDRHIILNTTAGVNLRTLTHLTQANAAGSDDPLRQGVLLPIFGMDIRESAQIQSHTKGTATGFDAAGGEPAGETTIAVDGNDSGTILAGDVVTWVGDTNKYIVQSATASGAASGNIVISKPGLIDALATTVEGALGDSYTANMFFHRNALQLVTRAPAMPEGGDAADDVTIITDPRTGLSFQVAVYKQYKQVHYEIGIAFGAAVIKPEHVGILLG